MFLSGKGGPLHIFSNHRRRLRRVEAGQKHLSAGFHAAAYLLTSDTELFRRTVRCFRGNGIDFRQALVGGISPREYTLLRAAEDILTDSSRLTLSDLANREVVDGQAFRHILNALQIARMNNRQEE